MLDIIQFIEEKGGDPEAIRVSQRARGDSVEVVDEIINGYKEWTKSKYKRMIRIYRSGSNKKK